MIWFGPFIGSNHELFSCKEGCLGCFWTKAFTSCDWVSADKGKLPVFFAPHHLQQGLLDAARVGNQDFGLQEGPALLQHRFCCLNRNRQYQPVCIGQAFIRYRSDLIGKFQGPCFFTMSWIGIVACDALGKLEASQIDGQGPPDQTQADNGEVSDWEKTGQTIL